MPSNAIAAPEVTRPIYNVMSKYYNPLMLHQGDTDELLSNMLKELEQAGVNDIITEKQKQLDEWLAENK